MRSGDSADEGAASCQVKAAGLAGFRGGNEHCATARGWDWGLTYVVQEVSSDLLLPARVGSRTGQCSRRQPSSASSSGGSGAAAAESRIDAGRLAPTSATTASDWASTHATARQWGLVAVRAARERSGANAVPAIAPGPPSGM